MRKFIRIIAAVMVAIFCLQTVAFADSGDPNIDNGGGGLKDGSSENFWNPGNDGVRVTVVDAETGAVKSASVDYTNTNASCMSAEISISSAQITITATDISQCKMPRIIFLSASRLHTEILQQWLSERLLLQRQP